MADPKHPLISPHAPHASPNLIRQGLKCQIVIGESQRAADGVAGALLALNVQKCIHRFFKTSASADCYIPQTAHAPEAIRPASPADESDESHREKTAHEPDDKGCRSAVEIGQAAGTLQGVVREMRQRAKASSDRLRTAGSSDVIIRINSQGINSQKLSSFE